jgi:POT family proton-dependent oligopeptide transporter
MPANMPANIDDVVTRKKHGSAPALIPNEVPPFEHQIALPAAFTQEKPAKQHGFYTGSEFSEEENMGDGPTDEELATLRRVAGKVPWKAYTLAFVELCERFSFYGATVVCK